MPDTDILVVCSGNICRSPAVERLLQRDLDAVWGPGALTVRSAGTVGLVGRGMDERAAAVLRDLGGDPDGFAARRLTPAMVRGAALVLAADRSHLAQVVRLDPGGWRRAFTVREAALLAAHADEAAAPAGVGPRARVEQVAATLAGARGRRRPGDPDELDIADPYRRGDAAFTRMGEDLRRSLPPLVTLLTGGSTD